VRIFTQLFSVQGHPWQGASERIGEIKKPIGFSDMNRKRLSGTGRFASSAAIALPVMIALLYLMTRLILPSENDRIVSRMIRNIELHRAVRLPEQVGIRLVELPQPIEEKLPPTQADTAAEGSRQTQNNATLTDEIPEKEGLSHVIDWWAEARRLARESDEESFNRFLLEQGFERYVSVMQGPVPITNGVQAELPPTQEDATGYMNSFGDMEYKISKNCVATTQVAARLDHSDFAKALPMIITCKPPPKQNFSFDRDD